MHRTLLMIGGGLNALVALLHVWLGRQIHIMSNITEGHRALMEMLNVGGTLMIAFFAIGSLGCPTDILTTKLGKLFIGFVVALYLSRAAEEILISPRFSAGIFGICLLIVLTYLWLLLVPYRPGKATL